MFIENHQKIYILVGKKKGLDEPLQSIITSFNINRLEELKVEYINIFDFLDIEECNIV